MKFITLSALVFAVLIAVAPPSSGQDDGKIAPILNTAQVSAVLTDSELASSEITFSEYSIVVTTEHGTINLSLRHGASEQGFDVLHLQVGDEHLYLTDLPFICADRAYEHLRRFHQTTDETVVTFNKRLIDYVEECDENACFIKEGDYRIVKVLVGGQPVVFKLFRRVAAAPVDGSAVDYFHQRLQAVVVGGLRLDFDLSKPRNLGIVTKNISRYNGNDVDAVKTFTEEARQSGKSFKSMRAAAPKRPKEAKTGIEGVMQLIAYGNKLLTYYQMDKRLAYEHYEWEGNDLGTDSEYNSLATIIEQLTGFLYVANLYGYYGPKTFIRLRTEDLRLGQQAKLVVPLVDNELIFPDGQPRLDMYINWPDFLFVAYGAYQGFEKRILKDWLPQAFRRLEKWHKKQNDSRRKN